jgi:predicted transposase YbfD/YdcC
LTKKEKASNSEVSSPNETRTLLEAEMKCSTSRVEYNPERQAFMLGQYELDLKSLYAHLEELTDKRKRRGIRYQLADALTLIILAKLGGEDEPRGMADWLRHRAELLVAALGLPRASMPHQSTISRILGQAVEAEELEQVVQRYLDGLVQLQAEELITLDGKTMRGTMASGETQGLHLLSGYAPETGVVLYQTEVGAKENEISAAPRLLAQLDLRHKVVIGDAMHTQRAASIAIVDRHGDYLWLAKDNQPELKATIEYLFAPQQCPPATSPLPTDFRTASCDSYGHGRCEARSLTASSMLKDYLDWPYLQQVFKLEYRRRQLSSGQVSVETHYGLTSLSAAQADPARLLSLKRRYWAIENRLHYRRDVSLNEDRCRLRRGQAARVMATLNNLVLALIDQLAFKTVPDARRFFSARPLEALKLFFVDPCSTLL